MDTIQFYRDKLGITQKALADMVGVSQGSIANWENGIRKPDIFMLKKLADVLHCTTDELLTSPDGTPEE